MTEDTNDDEHVEQSEAEAEDAYEDEEGYEDEDYVEEPSIVPAAPSQSLESIEMIKHRAHGRWIGTGVGGALLTVVLTLVFWKECVTTIQSHVLTVVLALSAAFLLWGVVGGLQIDVKLKFKALGEVAGAGAAGIFLIVMFSTDGLADPYCSDTADEEPSMLAANVADSAAAEGGGIDVESGGSGPGHGAADLGSEVAAEGGGSMGTVPGSLDETPGGHEGDDHGHATGGDPAAHVPDQVADNVPEDPGPGSNPTTAAGGEVETPPESGGRDPGPTTIDGSADGKPLPGRFSPEDYLRAMREDPGVLGKIQVVAGTVVKAGTKTPLENALVRLEYGTKTLDTKTDAKGKFSFTISARTTSAKVTISKKYYVPQTKELTLPVKATTIPLKPTKVLPTGTTPIKPTLDPTSPIKPTPMLPGK